MKTIEVDDELYQYIASNTKFIGESASDILRRLLIIDQKVATTDTDTVKPVSEQQKQKTEQDIDQSASLDADVTTALNDGENNVDVITETQAESSVNDTPVYNQDVFDLINKEELATQRGAVGRFLLILSALCRVHPQQFNEVLDIRGRDRLYFATSESDLLENGSSTKPKQIPDTKYWVITNSNTTKKKLMLTDVATVLGYSVEETEAIRDLL
ncbi:replication initiation negative regulator SeqA [Thalassotalea aquiviva]|uniref:replication initiation negative regulator SeqA n=1 Tax=Thalassotalea aquiviva TaxID=3242415 RepID=UPI00352B78DA